VSNAGKIGVNPVTGYVYLTNANNGTQPGSLTVISDTVVVGEIPVGTNPHAPAVDLLRGYVYVANYSDGTVTVITGTSVLTTVAVSAAPYEIGVEPNTGYAFVTDELEKMVYVLKGPELVGTTASEYGAHAVTANPSTGLTYIANEDSDSVSIILRDLPLRVFLPLIVRN
jgi:YVTN family beta-propeller protein